MHCVAHLLGHAQCFDEDGRKDDNPAEDTLGDRLTGDGLGATLNKGVLEDFLTDGELVIVENDFRVNSVKNHCRIVTLFRLGGGESIIWGYSYIKI